MIRSDIMKFVIHFNVLSTVEIISCIAVILCAKYLCYFFNKLNSLRGASKYF